MKSNTVITEIMTPKAVAEMLEVHPATVRRLRYRGVLPAYRLGRKVYFRRSEVIQAITANPIDQAVNETTPAA